jgi:DNA-directed RNA polymerase subunit alpha
MYTKELDNNISTNWTSMIKPIEFKVQETDSNKSTFVVEPLERGYGTTLANSLRRVLMSSLNGTAICAFKIEGVDHEYSSIKGVKEDVVEIVLNLKGVVFKGNAGYDLKKFSINLEKKCIVTAGMIQVSEGFKVANPNHVICHLTDNFRFKMDLIIRSGKGYVTSNEQVCNNMMHDFIKIDSLFTPVRNCSFGVESSRIGSKTEYDKLVLSIETNGSLEPELSLALAAKIIQDQMKVFICFNDVQEVEKPIETTLPFDKNLLRKIDDQELSVRSHNCLQSDNIVYLGDLVVKPESKMLKTPNFGRKSLNEIKQMLESYGLMFGMSVPEWPPENIEELSQKHLEDIGK